MNIYSGEHTYENIPILNGKLLSILQILFVGFLIFLSINEIVNYYLVVLFAVGSIYFQFIKTKEYNQKLKFQSIKILDGNIFFADYIVPINKVEIVSSKIIHHVEHIERSRGMAYIYEGSINTIYKAYEIISKGKPSIQFATIHDIQERHSSDKQANEKLSGYKSFIENRVGGAPYTIVLKEEVCSRLLSDLKENGIKIKATRK